MTMRRAARLEAIAFGGGRARSAKAASTETGTATTDALSVPQPLRHTICKERAGHAEHDDDR